MHYPTVEYRTPACTFAASPVQLASSFALHVADEVGRDVRAALRRHSIPTVDSHCGSTGPYLAGSGGTVPSTHGPSLHPPTPPAGH